jgi:hypothetical protein
VWQVDSEQLFPSLGVAGPFPSLGGQAALSPPKASSVGKGGWGKAAPVSSAGGGGGGGKGTVVGAKGGKGGWSARTEPYGGVAGMGRSKDGAGDMFEMDDIGDDDVRPEERQRRRDEAAARAWESALAASSAGPGASVEDGASNAAPAAGKAKKGRKAGQVLLAWG